jgi:hypothetical protein
VLNLCYYTAFPPRPYHYFSFVFSQFGEINKIDSKISLRLRSNDRNKADTIVVSLVMDDVRIKIGLKLSNEGASSLGQLARLSVKLCRVRISNALEKDREPKLVS